MYSRLTGQPERGAAAIAKAFRAMPAIAESHVEIAKLAWPDELGFAVKAGPDIGLAGTAPERRAHRDVVLAGRLRATIARLNPRLTAETRKAVGRKLIS